MPKPRPSIVPAARGLLLGVGEGGSGEKEMLLETVRVAGLSATGEPTTLAQLAGAMLQAGAQAAVVSGKKLAAVDEATVVLIYCAYT